MVVMEKMVEGRFVTEGCKGKEVEEVTFVCFYQERRSCIFILDLSNQLHFKPFIIIFGIFAIN